jgi:hypothetical protein
MCISFPNYLKTSFIFRTGMKYRILMYSTQYFAQVLVVYGLTVTFSCMTSCIYGNGPLTDPLPTPQQRSRLRYGRTENKQAML